jgi:hypothetical protein
LVTFTRASSGTFVGSDGLIQTAATNAPRFDHAPTTGESLGLLVEEARTNLQVRSEEFDNTGTWTRTGLSAVTANSSIAPDGSINADTLVEDASTGTHRIFTTSPSFAASTSYSCSVFVKASVRSIFRIGMRDATGDFVAQDFNLATQAVTSAGSGTGTITPAGNGWFRCTATGTTSVSGGVGAILLFAVQTAGSSIYTGTNGASAILLWGAQLEAGAFPSSYIPTTTATATRAADVISITGAAFSSWYRHDEGTLLVSASMRGVNTVPSTGAVTANGIVKLAESTATSNSKVILFNGAVSPNRYNYTQRSTVTTVPLNDASYETIQFGKTYNLAGSYVNNSTQGGALSVDGRTPITSSTVIDVPVPTRLLIGAGNSGSVAGLTPDEFYLNGTIKRITYWPQALPSRLQSITTL